MDCLYPKGTNLAHLMRPSCFDPDSSVRGSEAMQAVGGGEQVNHNLLQVLNIPNHKNEILLHNHDP